MIKQDLRYNVFIIHHDCHNHCYDNQHLQLALAELNVKRRQDFWISHWDRHSSTVGADMLKLKSLKTGLTSTIAIIKSSSPPSKTHHHHHLKRWPPTSCLWLCVHLANSSKEGGVGSRLQACGGGYIIFGQIKASSSLSSFSLSSSS